MKRAATFVPVLFLFAMVFAQAVSAQKIPSVAGNWSATTKMPDHNVSEQWTLQQTGGKVTGTVKTAEHGDLPLVGTIDQAGFLRAQVKNGDNTEYKVRATLDKDTKDTFDGSIVIGSREYLWSAKLSK